MNARFLAIGCMLLLAAPLSLAHDPAGTSRNYCEDPSEWTLHDYAPPATGFLIFNGQDGNIGGDCNGDGVPADYDGHIEWAQGGGWLSADSGDGVTTGSIWCFGEVAHHPVFGPIGAVDNVLGNTVPFAVASDTVSLVPPTDTSNCGDFESDNSADCIGSCSVTFPPGLDGTYQVYVGNVLGGAPGTAGHFCAPAADCPPVPPIITIPECRDGIDNDGDGAVDWPDDPGCDSPLDNSESGPGGLLGASVYVAPATAVVRSGGSTQIDVGALVCIPNVLGGGGACLSWGAGDSVELTDLAGPNIAYQACIDNSGDGVCTPEQGGPCGDQIYFSHGDGNAFYNPLGPLPTSFLPGCASAPGFNGFPGYVVFLCAGVHADSTGPHAHSSAGGTAKVTTGGTGYGDFCGGPQVLGKPYFVVG